jgi:hypothetical protein
VTEGDVIVFDLRNTSINSVFSSSPSRSSDGINHAYATTYTATGDGIPAGIFIGMEDLPNGQSDLDYNDDQFVFTNVSATPVPEPSSLIMLGSGLFGLGGVVRRRFCR